MAKSVMILTHGESSLTFRSLMDFNANNREENVRNLISYLQGVRGGAYDNLTVEARMGETAATATLTFTGAPTATETFTVNGVSFEAVASGATGNQFNIGGSVTATAANVVTAVNASSSAGVANVTASSSAGVVTFTCDVPGTVGNGFTLSEALTNATVSGANFSGGASDSDVTWTA